MDKNRTIPFFPYPALFSSHEDKYMDIVQDVLRRGAYILQKDLKEFEDNLKNFLNVKRAIGVADGTAALFLALKAAGIKAGDEVILPSHTFVASANAVDFLGAKPVLVECGKDHLIDATSVEKAITKKTRAIMPVQLNGRTANMDSIQAIANKHGLLIVEDSAQALGSKFKNKCAGTFGIAGTFSFYPAKLLGCFGDGGAVVTNDDAIAEKIRLMRDHGRNSEGDIVCWGTNSRLDNLQAAILNHKLQSFDQAIEHRRNIAKVYQKELGNLSKLTLPPSPDSDPDHFDVYQNYEVQAENRDALKSYLDEWGIKTIIQWGGKAIHQYEKLGFNVSLPTTEQMTSRFLLLPMNLYVTEEDASYISQKIRDFYAA